MKILVLGSGVIGTTYGLLFAQAGHHVRYVVRPEMLARYPRKLDVRLLDGRSRTPVRSRSQETLTALTDLGRTPAVLTEASEPGTPSPDYDFILVSVSSGALAAAFQTLRDRGLNDRVVLFSGAWETRAQLDALVGHPDYVLGYPIAGGRLDDPGRAGTDSDARASDTEPDDAPTAVLQSAVFDRVMLEIPRAGTEWLNATATTAFLSCGLTVERSRNFVHWLWIHQAINAGVISAIGARLSPEIGLEEAVRAALEDRATLAEAIVGIRECLGVVQRRGVPLHRHLADVWPYYLPKDLAAWVMVRMFRTDELAREIMLLHHNTTDLAALLDAVQSSAVELGVPTPHFGQNLAALRAYL